jgi:hypothetical protein
MIYKLRGAIKRNYGGGGGTPTTADTIPEWARPAIQNVQSEAGNLYGAGKLDNVAGVSDLQEQAFTTGAAGINRATGLGLDTMSEQAGRLTGMATAPSASTLAAQKEAIVQGAQQKVAGLNTGFGQGGTLGSARQAVMQGAQNAGTTAELAKVDADYETKMFQNRLAAEEALQKGVSTGSNIAGSGASGIANLGGQQRTIEQQQADAPWQALQRYASTVYGNPARQQTTTSGGK